MDQDELPPNSLPDRIARLRQICDFKDLAIYGTKKVLKLRLIEAGITTDILSEDQVFYSDMKVADLKLECKKRSLRGYSK